VQDHNRWTGSQRARDILDRWEEARTKFVKVFPHEYKRALGEIHARDEAAQTIERAKSSDKPKSTKAKA
jgi:glutamate synthase (NADPH) large chain